MTKVTKPFETNDLEFEHRNSQKQPAPNYQYKVFILLNAKLSGFNAQSSVGLMCPQSLSLRKKAKATETSLLDSVCSV